MGAGGCDVRSLWVGFGDGELGMEILDEVFC